MSTDLALIASAALMGLAGTPHCAAMCGPACAALCAQPGGKTPVATLSPAAGFHMGRVLGYALAGAAVSGGVQLLAWAGQGAAVLRPFWVMLHVAALALGLWMLWTGRQPAWMGRLGTARGMAATSGPWQTVAGPMPTPSRRAGAALAGTAWVAWPCGLLHSALVVSGLTHAPAYGATAMAAFALASAPGLHLMPWIWRRFGAQEQVLPWVLRAAGALLALGSAWALGHDLWVQVWNYCFG